MAYPVNHRDCSSYPGVCLQGTSLLFHLPEGRFPDPLPFFPERMTVDVADVILIKFVFDVLILIMARVMVNSFGFVACLRRMYSLTLVFSRPANFFHGLQAVMPLVGRLFILTI